MHSKNDATNGKSPCPSAGLFEELPHFVHVGGHRLLPRAQHHLTARPHRLCQWVTLGILWELFGICLEYVWNMVGIWWDIWLEYGWNQGRFANIELAGFKDLWPGGSTSKQCLNANVPAIIQWINMCIYMYTKRLPTQTKSCKIEKKTPTHVSKYWIQSIRMFKKSIYYHPLQVVDEHGMVMAKHVLKHHSNTCPKYGGLQVENIQVKTSKTWFKRKHWRAHVLGQFVNRAPVTCVSAATAATTVACFACSAFLAILRPCSSHRWALPKMGKIGAKKKTPGCLG